MGDPPVRAAVLEMDEPPFARGRVDESPLVRAVDGRAALVQDDPLLEGSEDALRPQHRLPAALHAAGRGEDVDPLAAPVELRPLDRRVAGAPVENLHRVVGDREPVGREPADRQDPVESRAALRPGVDEPEGTVGVAERARVDPPARLLHEAKRLPRAAGVAGPGGEDPQVGVSVPDLEPAIVVPDRRGPDAAAVPWDVVPRRGEPRRRVPRERPVDEVLRVEDREPRHLVEARGDEPVVVADADDVGVGPVGDEDRVAVGAAVQRLHGARIRGRRRRRRRLLRRVGEERQGRAEKEARRDEEQQPPTVAFPGGEGRRRGPGAHGESLSVVIPLCQRKS